MNGNIAKAGRKDKKTRYYYYCKNTVNATGHKCTFRCNIEQSQIDDVLAKLITAMTREGKFKDAIQDRIGATVDTSDLEKQLSVLINRFCHSRHFFVISCYLSVFLSENVYTAV